MRKLYEKMVRRINVPDKYQYFVYSCPTIRYSDHICSLKHVNERYVFRAIKGALKRQIQLAVQSQKKYGVNFYKNLKVDCEINIRKAKEEYESYQVKLQQLFEHYATGILDKEEYIEIKKEYTEKQEMAGRNLVEVQRRPEELLDAQKANIDWGEELIKCQNFTTIMKEIADWFIDRILIKNCQEIEVYFGLGISLSVNCLKRKEG